jgi:hypothetical protein
LFGFSWFSLVWFGPAWIGLEYLVEGWPDDKHGQAAVKTGPGRRRAAQLQKMAPNALKSLAR